MRMSKPGPSPSVEDDEIVEAIMAVPEPVASTADISKRIGLSNAQVLERVQRLEDAGILESKKIGNSNAWWVANL